MIKGFSLLEMIVALSLGLGILTIVLTNISTTGQQAKKVLTSQERLEGIFHAVDTIKSDLNKCGMRLQEAAQLTPFPLFEYGADGFKLTFGLSAEPLLLNAAAGAGCVQINPNDFFTKNRKIVIYNPDRGIVEFNEIVQSNKGMIRLKKNLESDFQVASIAVVLKEVEYRYYPAQQALKRKADRGNFQPLLEEVSDFFVTFFPDSKAVLYRIEVNKKEQIRGYIFLSNMVQP